MIDIEGDLKNALQGKTIVERCNMLRKCLSVCGTLNNASKRCWIALFDKYYTPDIGETKYALESIKEVYIQAHPQHGTHCFCMELADGTRCFASYKRLAGASGGKRTQTTNLVRALRHAVYDQIIAFRAANPLNPDDVCPVLKTSLGEDAEVDHAIPFAILKDDWFKDHSDAKEVYENHAYALKDKALEESWKTFHATHAVLRYVSKEGNKVAHKKV